MTTAASTNTGTSSGAGTGSSGNLNSDVCQTCNTTADCNAGPVTLTCVSGACALATGSSCAASDCTTLNGVCSADDTTCMCNQAGISMSSSASTGSSGSTGSTGSSGSTGSTGSTGGPAGDAGVWTIAAVPMPMVSSYPPEISGIWFNTPSEGAIATVPNNAYVQETGFSGGSEVYGMTGPTTISSAPIFSGDNVPGTGGVNVEFGGFATGPFGVVALTDEGLFVDSSSLTSLSFSATASNIGPVGSEQLVFLAEAPVGHWVGVDYAGNFFTGTSTAAGQVPTSWTTSPAATLCSPWAAGSTPPGSSSIYMSPDGGTLVWSAGVETGVCVSQNGGQTAELVGFPNPPADTYMNGVPTVPPNLITFADSMHGVAMCGGGGGFFTPYVYTTSNGGLSWKPGSLPIGGLIAGTDYSINDAFFSQDGKQVYAVGSFGGTPASVLLWVSSDLGTTWHDVSSAVGVFPGGDSFKTGFALDANDVWIGGTDNASDAVLAYATSGLQPVCGACSQNSDCASGSCNGGSCNLPSGTTCAASMCTPTACNAGNTACLCAIVDGGTTGWQATQVPWNDGVNFVEGIYFTSTTQGVLALAGAEGSPPSLGGPGALMSMIGPVNTDVVLFEGAGQGPVGNNLTFGGFMQSGSNLIALTDSRSLVSSSNGGQTWTNTPSGLSIPAGADTLSWLEQDSTGRWSALDTNGGLWQTQGTLSSSSSWASVGGTIFNGTTFAWGSSRFYETPSGSDMYFVNGVIDGVEESTDAGAGWALGALPGLPTDGSATGANVLVFHDANDGVVALPGNSTSGGPAPTVWITTNGGGTWTNATLPSSALTVQAAFVNAFYSPDGTNLWLIGVQANGTSILYHASGLPSSSVTFTDQSAKLNTFAGSFAGSFSVGFALDANDIWLGANGYLLYSNTGGQ